MRSIVLIQPHEGAYNKVFKPWVPLSLLATAAKLEQEGYPITIIDQRVDPNWEAALTRALSSQPLCVGVTSMSGSQILGALDASKLVRRHGSSLIVWGGVHATLFPEQTLANENVDIVVKGEGEESFYHLVKRLEAQQPLSDLPGVCFKDNGRIIQNPDRPFINPDDVPHPPYHLLNVEDYIHQYFNEKRVLELESSRGCPFDCAFCYNTPYNKRTWRPLSAAKVVERMRILLEKHGVRALHFIDDAFFIDKDRALEVMRLVIQEKMQIKIGFQGIRTNTFYRLDDGELELLSRAGTRFLQFGIESGSPRILEMINKKIKPEDVITMNRRLAAFPQIIPFYNFMCGFPTENREDLFATTALAWTLLRENPQALISPFHHYKPYPGTALAEVAMRERFDVPDNLEAWGRFDWTELNAHNQDQKMERLFKKVELASILADSKMEAQSDSAWWTSLAKIYRPLARFRLRHNFYSLMPESRMLK